MAKQEARCLHCLPIGGCFTKVLCYNLNRSYFELFAHKKGNAYFIVVVVCLFPQQCFMLVLIECFLSLILHFYGQIHSTIKCPIFHVCVFSSSFQNCQLRKFTLLYFFWSTASRWFEMIYSVNEIFFSSTWNQTFEIDLKHSFLSFFFSPHHHRLITEFIVSSLHLCNAAALVAQRWLAPAAFTSSVLRNYTGGSLALVAVRQPFEEGWKGGMASPWSAQITSGIPNWRGETMSHLPTSCLIKINPFWPT